MKFSERGKKAGFLAPLILYAAFVNIADAGTIYTSIEESECATPTKEVLALYRARGPEVQECKGVNGWQLYVVYTNERSWIDLKHGDRIWTTEEEVLEKNGLGFFPNVSEIPIEWSTTREGMLSSLIFSVGAQGQGKDGVMSRNISRYLVIAFKKDQASFCGIAKTKEKARALAASGRCDKELKRLAVRMK